MHGLVYGLAGANVQKTTVHRQTRDVLAGAIQTLFFSSLLTSRRKERNEHEDISMQIAQSLCVSLFLSLTWNETHLHSSQADVRFTLQLIFAKHSKMEYARLGNCRIFLFIHCHICGSLFENFPSNYAFIINFLLITVV